MRKIKMMVGMVIPLLGLASCGGNPTSQTPVENLKDAAIIVNTARIAYDDGSEEKLYHVRFSVCYVPLSSHRRQTALLPK